MMGYHCRETPSARERAAQRAERVKEGCEEAELIVEFYTSRLCTTAAWMNDANSGCGSNGRDFSSGWNCTPMNHGWSSYSTISGSTPSGDGPENRKPCCSSRSLYAV